MSFSYSFNRPLKFLVVITLFLIQQECLFSQVDSVLQKSVSNSTIKIDTSLTNITMDSASVKDQDFVVNSESTYRTDSLKIESHPQDVSDQAGFFIESGFGQLRIYGSVRLAGAYDFNGLTSVNRFSTYDIPVGPGTNHQPRFFMSPDQSRLGLEITRQSFLGQVKIKLETDFLGTNNNLRIRHAFAETGNFLVGQTWSTFTDVNSVPKTVDVDGPNSSVELRTVKIRYTNLMRRLNIQYVVSLESPEPDVSVPDSLSYTIPAQFIPDFAGQIIHNFPWGYLSFSGIFRGITVTDTSNVNSQVVGLGGLLAGNYNLDQDNKFLFQAVYGSAISRFIRALSGKGLDLIYDPYTKSYEVVNSFGLLFSYSHNWRPDISSAFTVGMVGINNKDWEPGNNFSQSWYYSANVFWNALLGINLGLEISQGERINVNGESGKATRVGFIFYADF